MIYRNNDIAALYAMEADRLGNNDCAEPRVCLYCPECGEPIYEDERYYEINGIIICDSCIEHYERTAEREG